MPRNPGLWDGIPLGFSDGAAAEREAWLEAVTNDPLLPGRILPPAYLGQ